jgi:CSLREA domain-containing protein
MAKGVVSIALVLAVSAAHAATYVVNTTDVDLPDTNTGLAACDANLGLIGDQCTLRAAIMQANASTGPHTIVLPLNATITLTLNGVGGAESGDLDITQPMTITGAPLGFPANVGDLPIIQASFAERLFDIGQNVAMTFRGLRLRDGAPSGVAGTNGGALRITASGANVLIDRASFSNNIASTGAAISNSGTLVVEGSHFSLNIASTGAAAIQTNGSGNTTLRGSSIREIRNEGVTREALRVLQGGTLIVENSFIDGASQLAVPAPTPTTGIRADRPALLVVRNSTLVDFTNHALDLVPDDSTTVRVYNSILAGSDLTDCALNVLAGPPAVMFGYNLVQTNGCGAAIGVSNVINQPALLGPLQVAETIFPVARRPLFGSVAIDGGAPVNAPGADPLRLCLGTDIYGTPRPLDGDADGTPRCDMGVVETSTLTSSTFVVNSYDADLTDANPGDDLCDVNPLANGSQCTLRAAVMEANAKPGPDRITFGGGAQTRIISLTRVGGGNAAFGDLDVSDQLTIDGLGDPAAPSLVSVAAAPGDRVFDVDLLPGQVFALRNIQVRDGEAPSGGGARIFATHAEIERVAFISNEATGAGGGLFAGGGTVDIRDSDFALNTSGTQGAAIASVASTTVVERSSLRRNTVTGAAPLSALAVESGLTLIVRFSTLHENTGGISTAGTGLTEVRASTIAGHADHGLYVAGGAAVSSVVVRETVFADNGTHCQFVGAVAGNTMAWNFLDAPGNACAPAGSNSQIGDPLLAPAARRIDDGVTWVRMPLHGSPLIDAIPADAGWPLCLGFDQRGISRPLDSDGNGSARCEIGAVELTAVEAGPREFVVNVVADETDHNPGDGICRVAQGGSFCSLRAAIMEANALPGADRVILNPSAVPYELTVPQAAGPDDASGDLRITDGVTIRGVVNAAGNRPTIAASMGDRLFAIVGVHTPVIIEGLRLAGGNSVPAGGAIFVGSSSAVSLRQLEIHGNSAVGGGGGIFATSATLLVEDSDLHDNHTDTDGAAIRSHASFLEIRRSSIHGNTDSGVGAEQEAFHASGDGSTLVRNSTFSGNAGTALRILDGDLEVNNVTLAGNGRRGIEFERLTGRNLLIRNTTLTGNTLGACGLTGAGSPGIATDGHNLTQGAGCDMQIGASNIVFDGPTLGPLVLPTAGEFTAHHLPLAGSPLRDAGHPDISALGCTATDQRGTQRPIDGNGDGVSRCDIGAIEAATAPNLLFSDGFE